MYIVVDKNTGIIVCSKGTPIYTTVLNDDYIQCPSELATSILVPEINTVYPMAMFDMYEINDTTVIDGMHQYLNGVVAVSTEIFGSFRDHKLDELSEFCEETILNGIDVVIGGEVEHFSLQLTDQIEITNQYAAVLQGVTSVLYHADGNGGNCKLYSAEEMTAIAVAARSFITYNKTYFNELKALIYRATTVQEINEMQFGMSLPKDLDDHLVSLVGKSSIPV